MVFTVIDCRKHANMVFSVLKFCEEIDNFKENMNAYTDDEKMEVFKEIAKYFLYNTILFKSAVVSCCVYAVFGSFLGLIISLIIYII